MSPIGEAQGRTRYERRGAVVVVWLRGLGLGRRATQAIESDRPPSHFAILGWLGSREHRQSGNRKAVTDHRSIDPHEQASLLGIDDADTWRRLEFRLVCSAPLS